MAVDCRTTGSTTMDKGQMLGFHRRRFGNLVDQPIGAEVITRETAGHAHEKMAHWANSLAEGLYGASEGPVHGSWRGCLYPDVCVSYARCALVLRRVRAINQAKYALAQARTRPTDGVPAH